MGGREVDERGRLGGGGLCIKVKAGGRGGLLTLVC